MEAVIVKMVKMMNCHVKVQEMTKLVEISGECVALWSNRYDVSVWCEISVGDVSGLTEYFETPFELMSSSTAHCSFCNLHSTVIHVAVTQATTEAQAYRNWVFSSPRQAPVSGPLDLGAATSQPQFGHAS